MRLVNLEAFLQIPGCVVYSYIGKESPEDKPAFSIIQDAQLSIRHGTHSDIGLWEYAPLVGIGFHGPGGLLKQSVAFKQGQSIANHPKNTLRWANYDSEGWFLVFDYLDVKGFADVLTEVLEQTKKETGDGSH